MAKAKIGPLSGALPRPEALKDRPTADELARVAKGEPPRACHNPSLFGCVGYVDEVRYCRICPWQSWRPGDPVEVKGG